MRVCVTDVEWADLRIEHELLDAAGVEVIEAVSRDPDVIVERAKDAQALLTQYAPITDALLARLPRLRVVSRYGVGVDNVDLDAAARRGVWVCNVPDYGTEEVALHASSMVLSLLRRLPFHDRLVRDGTWRYRELAPLPRASDLTLGLVGLGRIGRETARLLRPIFGRVAAYDPYLPEADGPDGVERLDLDPLFAASDVISLHVPLTTQTANLVDAQRLRSLRAGALLINTARGGLVDLDALHEALDSEQVAAAALDVLPDEPPPPDHPILRHPKVAFSPHTAWYSEPAERELRSKATHNVLAWARDGLPTNAVVEGARDG